MRLLVVSQYFWPEDFRINELVSALIDRGHAITVLTGRPNYPSGALFAEFLAAPARYADFHGARVIRVPMLPRGRGGLRLGLNYLSFAVSATIFGIARLWNERFDAIFVFEPSPVTVGLPAIALRGLKGWPIAFWVLDQWPETLAAVDAVTSKTGLWLVGRLVSFIYRRCDAILAQSRSLIEQVRRYAGERSNIVYFPNWVEASYAAGEVSPAPEVAFTPGTFTVMFAGNIGESQNFSAILAAAELLRERDDIRWLILGEGRAASWVREEVVRRGLQSRFILLGRFPQSRMPSFFRHADALVASLKPDPVFALTVPGKIQSYLASGLPVLGMLDGEGARLIDESRAGMTCPAGDSSRLAAMVATMSSLPIHEREAMGANGVAFAQQEFDRDLLVGKLEQILADLRSETRSRQA